MSDSPASIEDRYTALADTFLSQAGVAQEADITQPKKAFGSSALRINNKIFAMLTRARLVVKLPRQRVDALIADGVGERYDPGRGRLMKEWLAVDPAFEDEWRPLATEAMEFVGSGR